MSTGRCDRKAALGNKLHLDNPAERHLLVSHDHLLLRFKDTLAHKTEARTTADD